MVGLCWLLGARHIRPRAGGSILPYMWLGGRLMTGWWKAYDPSAGHIRPRARVDGLDDGLNGRLDDDRLMVG